MLDGNEENEEEELTLKWN